MNCQPIIDRAEGGWVYFHCAVCKDERKVRDNGGGIVRTCRGTGQPGEAGQCVHRGAELRRELCQSCGGNVQVKVFACVALSECTIAKVVGKIPCCFNCQQFAPLVSVAEAATPSTSEARQP